MQFTIQSGFTEAHRDMAAALYWQAFSEKLGKIMGPDDKAQTFFRSILNPQFAISAQGSDGQLLGMAGFKTAQGALTGASMQDLAAAYGWLGALWRAPVLSILERDLMQDTLVMDGIFVSADARGLGVGTALLDAVKTEALQRGLGSVRLDVIDVTPRARALYEREGFVALGTTHIGLLRHIFGFQTSTAMQFTVKN